MKIRIETANAAAGWKFSRSVTEREDWSAESHGGGSDFKGSGSTRTGRNVSAVIAFGEDGDGQAVIEIDAPESKGRFLQTVLEEIAGQSALRRDTAPGAKPADVPPELTALAVTVDGQPKGWECVPCAADDPHPETATLWWWTVAL